eukprot:5263614-Ditylum_brightwellii.AAC.1
MHNKRLGKEAMQHAEGCLGIAIELYSSRELILADLQALTTRLLYNCVLLKGTPATSLFIDLVSNYDLVVHNAVSIALQKVAMPKSPILYAFKMLQYMIHTVRIAHGDSIEKYGDDM